MYGNDLHWFRVARTKNVGPLTFNKLIKKHHNPLDAVQYLTNKGFDVVSEECVLIEINKLKNIGGTLISYLDPYYPPLLNECADRPAFLSCLGNIELLKRDMISIVGSRNASIYGCKIAANLATDLADHGYVIASGMASGIDTAAHSAVPKSTIAVLAGGIDVVYPIKNFDLYNILKEDGLIISEAPFGVNIAPTLFHARNRIIAGMAIGTVIVEGLQNSGSMITVNYAGDYNREIFAIPGSPLEPRAYAPNKAIQKGAYLITEASDIIENLSINRMTKPKYVPLIQSIETAKSIFESAEDFYGLVLSSLTTVSISIDELHSHVGGAIGKLRAALIDLQLDGKVIISMNDCVSLS